MTEVIKFMEKLLEEMQDTSWSILEITDYKETIEDGGLVAKLPNGETYRYQGEYFIEEIKTDDDCYSGKIIYPITDKKALVIEYDC